MACLVKERSEVTVIQDAAIRLPDDNTCWTKPQMEAALRPAVAAALLAAAGALHRALCEHHLQPHSLFSLSLKAVVIAGLSR